MFKLTFLLLMLISTFACNPIFAQTVFVVQANQQWQDTGIPVVSGDKITIVGEGIYRFGGLANDPLVWAKPDGLPNLHPNPNGLLVPNASICALVAKIGSSNTAFGVGSFNKFSASASGNLFLAINDGVSAYSDNNGYLIAIITKNVLATTSVSQTTSAFPDGMDLGQNYPNPFNPSTTFAYTLIQRSKVKVEVFNELGQLVTTLVDGISEVGNYQVSWNGKFSSGTIVSNGTYFYRLSTDGAVQTKKMIMIK